jgi:hypothetical protein
MFQRILSKVTHYYYVPTLIIVPIMVVSRGYEEYVTYQKQNVSLTLHTFCCIGGACSGAVSGAFLGLIWPISLPIFIGRCIDAGKK